MSTANETDQRNNRRLVDQEILRSLAICVRLLSLDQVSRMRHCTRPAAKQFMRRLVAGRLVQRSTVIAQALPALPGPLAYWKPGLKVPDATAVSRQARKRYSAIRLQRITAYTATTALLHHFGCDERPAIKRDQQTHDLGVSETYLYVRRRWPLLAKQGWVGEDHYAATRERGDKVEDAQLRDPRTGRTLVVVEFAGQYETRRVRKFIDWMTYANQPFMLF